VTVGDVIAPLFGPVDWERLLLPTTPLLETVIRGSFVYLALFALLRFVFRRESGAARISMLLLLVLLADAAQNAMADDYTSVTDGLLLVGTIMAWDYVLDWTASRFPAVQDLIHPRPLLLIRNGRILNANLKRELMSEEELWSGLRQHGVEDVSDVKTAYLEGDGQLSVLRRGQKGGHDDNSPRARRRAAAR
jgi:uncharacterized membrane protein YcaP (DUF421 family)